MKELNTKRLKLRKLKEDDASSIFYNWASDEEVTKYITWDAHKSIEDTKAILSIWLKEYEKENTYRWGIVLKETNELIGAIDVVGYSKSNEPIIGYVLSRKHWNNGYMSETLSSVCEYLFLEGFETIKIEALIENTASNKVILKNGFKLFKQEEFVQRGNKTTLNQYQLTKKL